MSSVLYSVRTQNFLDAFVSGYIECALWSESAGIRIADDGGVTFDDSGTADSSFLDLNFDRSDIERDSYVRIVIGCSEFIAANMVPLWHVCRAAWRMHPGATIESVGAQMGHDFWLTRNGHGAGYWDRGYGPAGDRMTEACRPYGGASLYYIGEEGADISAGKVGYEA